MSTITATTTAANRSLPFLGTHNATVTVVSPRTGDHRTFKIATVRDGDLAGRRIIALLTGPDNDNDYTGFGFVKDDGTISVWRRCRGTVLEKYADLFDRPAYWQGRGVEYLPEARCRRCNRKLTHPSSLASGIGPECASRGARPPGKKPGKTGNSIQHYIDIRVK